MARQPQGTGRGLAVEMPAGHALKCQAKRFNRLGPNVKTGGGAAAMASCGRKPGTECPDPWPSPLRITIINTGRHSVQKLRLLTVI
jgi:hypothetical protein